MCFIVSYEFVYFSGREEIINFYCVFAYFCDVFGVYGVRLCICINSIYIG